MLMHEKSLVIPISIQQDESMLNRHCFNDVSDVEITLVQCQNIEINIELTFLHKIL